MSRYKIKGNDVVNLDTGMRILNNSTNEKWQEYLVWVDDGNTADPEFAPADTTAFIWMVLRSHRNLLLQRTDFFIMNDFYNNILTEQERTDLVAYRQALRDLPSNTPDPRNEISWPEKPQIMINYGL